MTLTYQAPERNAALRLLVNDPYFAKLYGRQTPDEWLTIAWNTGPTQNVTIENSVYDFPAGSVLPLVSNQSYSFCNPQDTIVWQFNRNFYCIVTHDKEVGCAGFLFYGAHQTMFITPDANQSERIARLYQVFRDELVHTDNLRGEMLRLLLVRLITTLTRIGKEQYSVRDSEEDNKFGLYRQFNIMVEMHYKKQHEVQFYASALNKSPKTIANTFALYGTKSPSQIISDRIALEARRLFYNTDKSVKEVYLELGFEDASHFSRFFKKHTNQSPSDFKRTMATSR